MDHADDGGGDNNDVFVYMGGIIPRHMRETITHVRVHKSVKIITERAFEFCRNLVSIEMHDGVEIIGKDAFYGCRSLRGIKLPGVRVIGDHAFGRCNALEGVEFGDNLLPPSEDNPRGFFEDENVVELNDFLLYLLGSNWYDLTDLPDDPWNYPFLEKVEKEERECEPLDTSGCWSSNLHNVFSRIRKYARDNRRGNVWKQHALFAWRWKKRIATEYVTAQIRCGQEIILGLNPSMAAAYTNILVIYTIRNFSFLHIFCIFYYLF